MSRTHSIATIGADGIGPEVVQAGVRVLQTLAQLDGSFGLKFTDFDWSSETYKKTGAYIPEGGLDQLKKHDAILFGAVGAPDVPDHISLWGLRLAICQGFQQFANVRPTKIFRGTESPLRNASHGTIDWTIVRENSEGEYAGQGGRSHRGQAWEMATEVSIFSRHGIERIMRFAFETAQKRPRKFLTVVTKSNAQRNGMVLWDEVAADVAKHFLDVKWDKMLVVSFTFQLLHSNSAAPRLYLLTHRLLVALPNADFSGCYDCTHGVGTKITRHHRGHESACRHSVRPGSCPRRFHRHSPYVEPRSDPTGTKLARHSLSTDFVARIPPCSSLSMALHLT
jgi:hypothetical protein